MTFHLDQTFQIARDRQRDALARSVRYRLVRANRRRAR